MLPTLLPDPTHVRLDCLRTDDTTITVLAAAKAPRARCPLCAHSSSRIHSRYVRTLADLPWNRVAVRVRLTVRRFRCDNADCVRQLFTERLPEIAVPYARRTTRLVDVLELVGFALGGEAGARLLARLTMGASPATLLRHIRRATLPAHETPRVLGVDDWALRKGQCYGTVLVDLEQRRVVDLLPNRTAETLAAWLQEHRGVEIVSRDRGGAYAEGARQGAPNAIQIADRFHVLSNLRQALERLLTRHHGCLRGMPAAASEGSPPQEEQHVEPSTEDTASPRPPTRAEREKAERRDRRYARYEEVLRLHRAGQGIRAIARELDMARATVGRFLQTDEFPERAPRPRRPGIVTPFERYLRERWAAGCQNAEQLYREIRTQGYTGSCSQVRNVLATWRRQPGKPGRKAKAALSSPAPAPPQTESLSPRQGSWLVFRAQPELEADERRQAAHILERCPDAVTIAPLVQEFRRLVRELDEGALEPWLEDVEASGVPELVAFAAGIRRDRAAIDGMLRMTWSNGQVEGQVNRIKALKRQMYGRANLDLLRCRVLRAA